MATPASLSNPLFTRNLNVGTSASSDRTFIARKIEPVCVGKYVTIDNVMARIARNVKGKNLDIGDIVEWCAECEVEEIGEYEGFVKFYGVPVTVKKNKADLPCNVYRILSVFRNRCAVPKYDFDGCFLRFNYNDPSTVSDEYTIEIDYLGVAVDERGYPLIQDGHQEPCYWYCLTKIYFEDFLNGNIPTDRYEFMLDRLGHYVSKVKSSMRNTTRDDMNDVARILYNMVPKVRMSRDV